LKISNIKEISKNILWQVYDLSGVRAICNKIKPEWEEDIKRKGHKKPSTLLLWVLSIYVGAYGVASVKYENRVDKIENRINSIYSQIPKDIGVAFSRIDNVQNMLCPVKPDIYNPISIIDSLSPSKDEKYDEGVAQLKELVEDWAKRTETIEKRLEREPQAKKWIDDLEQYIEKNDYGNTYIGVLAHVDLENANLQKANLEDANLQKADLYGANLQDVNLKGANLQDAYLHDANLQNAKLERVNLQSAALYDANLQNADFEYGANLQDANLAGANLQFAELANANLQDANLAGANLQDADLSGVNLQNARLIYVNLQSAELNWADLQNANLIDTNLQNADFLETNLKNSCLCYADLKNVRFLDIEQLSKTVSLYGVKNLDSDLEKQIKEKHPHLLKPNYDVRECNNEKKGEFFLDYIKNKKGE
jgi:uncharacterized protein YjbI with pentapeptide repeats